MSNGVDRISFLPDCIIEHILSFLSVDLVSVVRTSVLSKRWKTCWTRVTNLVFDMEVLTKRNVNRTDLDFVSVVNSVLSRHDGTLHQFYLSARLDEIKNQTLEMDVYRWLHLLLQKRVREISISVFLLPHRFMENSVQLRMLEISTLTHLTLSYCKVPSSTSIGGFPNLIQLHLLDEVSMSSGLLETIISDSPLLKDLKLMSTIILYDNYPSPAVIHAPSLQSLSLICDESFCLKVYPVLTSASLSYDSDSLELQFKIPITGPRRISKLEEFVRVMPRVQTLLLDTSVVTDLSGGDIPIPMKLQTELPCLKDLVLDYFDILRAGLPAVFCLIWSSPNLQTLVVHVRYLFDIVHDDWKNAIRCCAAQVKAGIMSSTLTQVTFDCLTGTTYELLLIRTIIHCNPMLKTINIVSQHDILLEDEVWLFTKLLKMRLSKSATMIFQPQSINEKRKLFIYGNSLNHQVKYFLWKVILNMIET